MEKSTLLERINKKEIQVKKLVNKFDKYSRLVSEEFLALINQFLRTGDRTNIREYTKTHSTWSYLEGDEYELYHIASDLYDVRVTLDKYNNQLAVIEAKSGIIKNPIIWQFLLDYKAKCYQWFMQNADKYKELKENFVEAFVDYETSDSGKCHLAFLSEYHKYNPTYYLEQEFKKTYYADIHPLSIKIVKEKFDIEKHLNKEIENKYFKLINEITKITGEIIDAERLTVNNGELNGIIKGKNGTASINTISAGGWNIQCFHYRTLVKKIS